MRKLCTAVNVLVTVLVPVGFLVNLCYDLAHPELWCDWQHDPRLYGTLAIVVIPPILWIGVRTHRSVLRLQKRNARLNRMLEVVKDLLRAGQCADAEKAYALYHRVKAAGNEQEADSLANRFADLYGT
jgi:hypothetical protein